MADRGVSLSLLVKSQCGKCHYCNCEMVTTEKSPRQATLEHLVDKWSSRKHVRDNSPSNLVAACFECNNTRGAKRNRIARDYYKTQAVKRGMKLAVASTSSKILYSLFGPVPQQLFNVKEIQNA